MRVELSKLHDCLQTTMIYVTCEQTAAMSLENRIVDMKKVHFFDKDTEAALV